MAETQPTTVKDQLAKDSEARKKQNEEVAKRMESSKPTPSQEENDRARLGDDVKEKADDGSGPEVKFTLQREVTADKPSQQGYGTRQVEQQKKPA
jgi:hypothetical protein